MRRIALGAGFRYLMESVAAGDGAATKGTGISSYYAQSGTPPGVFVGAGLASLGLRPGEAATEEHLWRMLGVMAHPLTGQPVGSVPRAGSKAKAVAGFDLTFSPSKSISTMWALADPATREVIYRCHRQAIDYILRYAEREVFHSRSGRNGIVQEDIAGVVAASFTHWDNRSGDPQLHDHVVVWNRARSSSDGQWRTIDSRGLYKAVVTLSEMHQGVLSDLLTAELGVGWDARSRRHSDRPRWEIAGVPEVLLREFSQRNEQVEARKDLLMAQFVSALGRQPTAIEVMEMRRRATVLTRPEKRHRSLAAMRADWIQRADPYIGDRPAAWVETLKNRNDLPLLQSGDLASEILTDAAQAVTHSVAERRSTYSRANLVAEAHRVIGGIRFSHPDERVRVAERIVDMAVKASLELTPPDLCHVPAVVRRPDGSSRLRPKGYEVYTTPDLFEAETRLLAAARRIDGPVVDEATVAATTALPLPGRDARLSLDQAVAIEKVATSGRPVDVLIGPAGAGKSTAMAGLRAVWEAEHGPGSVIGLAPSAAAAEVLGDELGIDTDNTAKWLAEHHRLPERLALRSQLTHHLAIHPASTQLRRQITDLDAEIGRWRLQPGQLVVVDEATLAGTFALDQLASAVSDAGAKLLLVGDPAQLSGVEAGGAFSLLSRDRGHLAPQLSDVRRFRNAWEAAASIALRRGDESAVDAYQGHHRIAEGSRDDMLDAIHTAWRADADAGRLSLMIAGDSNTVAELNRRARAGQITAGYVVSDGVVVANGQAAGVGDHVVTRQNDRRIHAGLGRWVKNGDRWTVTATSPDGSMTVRRADGAASVFLPRGYVTEHVELAYATTAHRAQGRTVDTAHVMVSPITTREALYVSATRGRHANHLYVDTKYDPDPATGHDGAEPAADARQVVAIVLANEGADISAHETIRRSRTAARSWPTLWAEYQTIASLAQAERWDRLIAQSGLTEAEQELVRLSPARGALHAALREAEGRGVDVEAAFPRLVGLGGKADVDDIAAVLHARVERWTEEASLVPVSGQDLVGGLVSRAVRISDPDMTRALDEREQAMERRARELAHRALRLGEAWTDQLGCQPADPVIREKWMLAISTVAGYRDMWSIKGDPRPLGPDKVSSTEQLRQRRLAQAASETAVALAQQDEAAQLGAPIAAPYLREAVEHRGVGI